MVRLIALIAFAACLLARPMAASAQQEAPPEIDKGWSIVSVPCDINLSDLKQKTGAGDLKVFDWDGSKYSLVEALERGRGYLFNSNAVLNTSSACNSDDNLPADFSKQFRQGWNLIGNPFHKTVTFQSIFGPLADDVLEIYEYNRGGMVRLSVTDNMKPMHGYWIFTRGSMSVQYGGPFSILECDTFDIDLAGLNDMEVYTESTFRFRANCGIGDRTYDVTADAVWSSIFDFGNFVGRSAPGEFVTSYSETAGFVTAVYGKSTAKKHVIVMKKGKTLQKLELKVASRSLMLGEKTEITVTGAYSDGTFQNLTAEAEFVNTNPQTGDLTLVNIGDVYECRQYSQDCSNFGENKAVFFGRAGGVTKLTTIVGRLQTKEIEITVAPDELTNILLTADRPELGTRDSVQMHAIAVYSSGRRQEVNFKTEWNIESKGAVNVSKPAGAIYGAAEGEATVTATFDGMTSNAVHFTVGEQVLAIRIICMDAINHYFMPGDVLQVRVEAQYAGRRVEDVTSKARWKIANDMILSSNGDGTFTAKNLGDTYITALYQDTESEILRVKVAKEELQSISISSQRTIMDPSDTAIIFATAYYLSGNQEYVTKKATWTVQPSNMAKFEPETGKLYPRNIGEVSVTAEYEGKKGNIIHIKIEPKQLTGMTLYTDGDLRRIDCFVFSSTDLGNYIALGAKGNILITGSYNTGGTGAISPNDVHWEVSDEKVLEVAGDGSVTAISMGNVKVRAYKEGVYSEWMPVLVTDMHEAHVLTISSYVDLRNKPVEAGSIAFLDATYSTFNPDAGCNTRIFTKEVTNDAEWISSNPAVGTFDKGVFTGVGQGTTEIYARYGGMESNRKTLRVWKRNAMNYCNPDDINDDVWQDEMSYASIETDCKTYAPASPVKVRFLAEEKAGLLNVLLNVCLDLYIYDDNQRLVKTFEDNKCSPEALFRAHPGDAKPVYDYMAEWNRIDDNGKPVPPGEYTAVARFYLTYCPVIKVKFTLQ